VVVYGDVNSTMAAAIVASKLHLRIAHVEAGLRSNDRTMPEEINRLVTDRLADLLLTPSRDADEQLRREGEPDSEIAFVGNVMVDSLFYALPTARATGFRRTLDADGSHVVVTMHRPSNVDEPARLQRVVGALAEIARERPVYFPAHPRTRERLERFGIDAGAVRLLEPVSYFEMLDIVEGAHAVVTDSGGLQEETTALNVPCFTVRENTERPVTITEGTNQLTPDPDVLPGLVRAAERPSVPRRPEGWDGCAGGRVAEALAQR
jgi:UDP-N-acetylglucosamine 2-epimerase (non-hydrolysing)